MEPNKVETKAKGNPLDHHSTIELQELISDEVKENSAGIIPLYTMISKIGFTEMDRNGEHVPFFKCFIKDCSFAHLDNEAFRKHLIIDHSNGK